MKSNRTSPRSGTITGADDDDFEGLEESEFEAIVEKTLCIPSEQAAIRAAYPE